VVAAVCLLAEVFVFEGVRPGGVMSFPTRVELMKFMAGIRGWAEEGAEELL